LSKVLSDESDIPPDDEQNMIRDSDILLNSLVVVCWFEGDANVSKSWYLGYVNEVVNGGDRFMIEHLHREKRGHDRVWRFPVKADIAEVDVLQIMPVEPKFTWDYSNLRAHKLVLDNYIEVAETVKNTDAVVLDD